MTLDLLQSKAAYLSFFVQIADRALLSKFVSLARCDTISEKIALRLARNLDVDLAASFLGKLAWSTTQHAVLRVLLPRITQSSQLDSLV